MQFLSFLQISLVNSSNLEDVVGFDGVDPRVVAIVHNVTIVSSCFGHVMLGLFEQRALIRVFLLECFPRRSQSPRKHHAVPPAHRFDVSILVAWESRRDRVRSIGSFHTAFLSFQDRVSRHVGSLHGGLTSCPS